LHELPSPVSTLVVADYVLASEEKPEGGDGYQDPAVRPEYTMYLLESRCFSFDVFQDVENKNGVEYRVSKRKIPRFRLSGKS